MLVLSAIATRSIHGLGRALSKILDEYLRALWEADFGD